MAGAALASSRCDVPRPAGVDDRAIRRGLPLVAVPAPHQPRVHIVRRVGQDGRIFCVLALYLQGLASAQWTAMLSADLLIAAVFIYWLRASAAR